MMIEQMVVSSKGRRIDHDRYLVAQLFHISPTDRGRCDYQYLLPNDQVRSFLDSRR